MRPLSLSEKKLLMLKFIYMYVQSNLCSLIASFVLPFENVVIHRDIASYSDLFI